MQSVCLQRIMKKNADRGYEKTNPIQTQSNPILSAILSVVALAKTEALAKADSNGAYSPLAGSYLIIYNTTPEPFTNNPIGQLCK